MSEIVPAWQCIGCGRIESLQTCVGVCQDRKVEFVYAQEHREALAVVNARLHMLEKLVRQLAQSTPRNGEWERSYRALQERARLMLSPPGATLTP
jgi:altronate dehydratase